MERLMNSFSFPPIALPVCVLAAALAGLSGEASGQSGSQLNRLALNAAIAEAGRSPFHARHGASVPVSSLGEPTARPFRDGVESRGVGRQVEEELSPGDTHSGAVFLAAAIEAPVANTVALSLAFGGAYAEGTPKWAHAAIAGGAALSLLGPPVGATLVGGHFGGAMMGSAVGTVLGLLALHGVGDEGFAFSLSLYSLLQAGATTLFENLARARGAEETEE